MQLLGGRRLGPRSAAQGGSDQCAAREAGQDEQTGEDEILHAGNPGDPRANPREPAACRRIPEGSVSEGA
ncbi:hypothetical protein GCM10007886_44390 [Methylobacterium gregans]|nr:hypothetical protein GCM10007886_44390 [Methylobacterium gregans]